MRILYIYIYIFVLRVHRGEHNARGLLRAFLREANTRSRQKDTGPNFLGDAVAKAEETFCGFLLPARGAGTRVIDGSSLYEWSTANQMGLLHLDARSRSRTFHIVFLLSLLLLLPLLLLLLPSRTPSHPMRGFLIKKYWSQSAPV